MNTPFAFFGSGKELSAYEACLEAHLVRLWHLSLRFETNVSDAEDLLQELLRRAWRYRKRLLRQENPGAWLAKVLYRLHVDRWRRNHVWREASSLDDEAFPAYQLRDEKATTGLEGATYAELQAYIDQLPGMQRTVLLLHDAEGYTLEEISKIQDVPVGTLKSRLHRARMAVRAHYQ